LDSYKGVILKGNSSTKLVDIDNHHRMLLKFMTECFFQKGGGSDQPSVDHKLVLYFLAAYDKINLPKYIMHHLCWAVKEGIRGKRKQIPCGRLLSEIFTQGKLLETLRKNNLASDKTLRTRTGKMINGKTLQNMKIIKKFSPNEKDLKESTAPTKLMKDFPPIYQERNPKVLAKLVADLSKNQASVWMLKPLKMLMKSLSKSEGRGPLLMLAQKPLVLRPRSQGKTLLKHPFLTTALLLFPKGKEEKENPLLLIPKKGLQILERKKPKR